MSGVSTFMLWGTWFFTGVIVSFLFFLMATLIIYFIPGSDNSHVINKSSVSVILFLNLMYCATISSGAILTSTVIKKEKYCQFIVLLIHFLSILPSMTRSGPTMKAFIFNPSTAYSIGLFNIFFKENYMSGYNWTNLNDVATYYLNVRLSMVLVALFVEAIVYLLIAIYLDAVIVYPVGYPKPWNFCFKGNFWRKQNNLYLEDEEAIRQKNPLPTGKLFQPDPKLPVAIQALGLTKTFNKKVVVENVTFNAYENQITALIGHNGAGKSTIVNMITGVLPPTSGTAVINGYDIRFEKKWARKNMGFCPQQNLFFDDLTVSEQLLFFATVRGSSYSNAKKEIMYLCTTAQLHKMLHVKAKKLSGGSKRKLCVLTALCGNTKLIILDEPTSGVDPMNRKSMWGILRALKQDRTILLITHHMDEADSLADRIILMEGGRLQSIGSGTFLKKEYEIGYRIAIEMGPNANEQAITNFMRGRGGQLHRVSGNDLVFDVPLSSVGDVVKSLENDQASLNITSFGVFRTPLDEIFIDYVAEKHDEKVTKINTLELEMIKPSLQRQFIALMYKKAKCSLRDRIAIFQIIIVIIFYLVPIISFLASKALSKMLFMTLADYYDVIVLTEDSDKPYWREYKEIVEAHGGVVEVVEGRKLIDEALARAKQDYNKYQNRYVIGTSFGSPIIAYYNQFESHSIPLVWSTVINAILRKEKGEQYKINIYNFPKVTGKLSVNNIQMICLTCIVLALVISIGLPLMFYANERQNKSKHLQIISGANVILYWLTALLWEMLVMMICMLIITIISNAIGIKGIEKSDGFGRGLVILLVGGLHLMCFIFLMSHIEWSINGLFTAFMLLTMTSISVLGGFYIFSDTPLQTHPKPFLRFLYRLIISIPLANLIECLLTMAKKNAIVTYCSEVGECTNGWTKNCSMVACEFSGKEYEELRRTCCNFTANYYEWNKPGIGRLITYAVFIAIISLILCILIDLSVFKYLVRSEFSCFRSYRKDDEDILNEESNMKSLSNSEIKENFKIALLNVTKMFFSIGNIFHCKFCVKIAVRNAYLGVKNNECFGLLGLNGAGKTTTFEIITGEIAANSGKIYVNGYNVRRKTNKVQKSIGYCPQTDTVISNFTGRENLIYFLILRGYSLKSAKILAEATARKHGFYSHIDKYVDAYSGGNKRKLCLAIALLVEIPILALDEPTSGVDPGSRRYMYSLITEASSGKTTLLTTHQLEDCEAMCSRAVIMANGKFKCVGSLQHLKSKFAEGFNIMIKLAADKQGNPLNDKQLNSIKNYIDQNFSRPTLVEELSFSLAYKVSHKDTPWSKAFSIMENARRSLPIEDYSIDQCGLDDVFLTVAEK